MTQKLLISVMLALTVGCIITVCAEDAKTLMDKSVELINQGKYEEALVLSDELLKLDPEDPYAMLRKVCALGSLHRYQEAIDVCDEIIALYPELSTPWSMKGSYLQSLGRIEEGKKAIERGTQLRETEAVVGQVESKPVAQSITSQQATSEPGEPDLQTVQEGGTEFLDIPSEEAKKFEEALVTKVELVSGRIDETEYSDISWREIYDLWRTGGSLDAIKYLNSENKFVITGSREGLVSGYNQETPVQDPGFNRQESSGQQFLDQPGEKENNVIPPVPEDGKIVPKTGSEVISSDSDLEDEKTGGPVQDSSFDRQDGYGQQSSEQPGEKEVLETVRLTEEWINSVQDKIPREAYMGTSQKITEIDESGGSVPDTGMKEFWNYLGDPRNIGINIQIQLQIPETTLSSPGTTRFKTTRDAKSWKEIAEHQSKVIDMYSSQAAEVKKSQYIWKKGKDVVDIVGLISSIQDVTKLVDNPEQFTTVVDILNQVQEKGENSPEEETAGEVAGVVGILIRAYATGGSSLPADILASGVDIFAQYQIRQLDWEEKYLIYNTIIAKNLELSANHIDTILCRTNPTRDDIRSFVQSATEFNKFQEEQLIMNSFYDSEGKTVALSAEDSNKMSIVQNNLENLKHSIGEE